ncbi:hypothetical protein [Methanogenium cariaci]|uniref:hypothetical protein n=1 Tax=Methanogenium cariaci TaxID=2197 RepID=UPI00078270EA|nr:hypothetical protein [Methanogenium cariaci]
MPPPSSVENFAGTYQSTRHNYRTFEFWLTPPQQMLVKTGGGDDGTILMSRGGRPPVAYTEIEPGVFVPADGTETFAGNVVFRKDTDGGEVTFLCLENVPIMAFERVPWYAADACTTGVKNAGILILLTVLLWPVMAVCRQIYDREGGNERIQIHPAAILCKTDHRCHGPPIPCLRPHPPPGSHG